MPLLVLILHGEHKLGMLTATGLDDGPRYLVQAPPEKPELSARESREGLLTGTLVDHGSAPYLHDPRAAVSCFVKLETSRGDRVIWGVDLERALKESLTKPQIGDEVGLHAVRQDPVTVRKQQRDEAGKLKE